MLTINLSIFKVKEDDLILDAGCGDGRHTLEVAKRPCFLVALDTSFIDLLRVLFALRLMENNGEVKAEVDLVRGDVRRLPFRSQSFSKVICTEVLEHVREDREAIREIVRVMMDSGVAAVSVPTRVSERLYGRLSAKYFRTPGGHIRIYKAENLRRKLQDGGLKVVRVCYEHALHTVYWLLKCLAGLDNDDAIIPALWRVLLVYSSMVKPLRKIEEFLNHVFPKSIVFYLRKASGGEH
ncbi:MAG: class I SAM-dependent methyltransferase [Candidatus Freyarchaeota archaeon]